MKTFWVKLVIIINGLIPGCLGRFPPRRIALSALAFFLIRYLHSVYDSEITQPYKKKELKQSLNR